MKKNIALLAVVATVSLSNLTGQEWTKLGSKRGFRLKTNDGTLEVGQRNKWFVHFLSDSEHGIYFSQGLWLGNGKLSSYKENLLQFQSQGVTKMTMLPNGNFGIGTTQPSQRLHVAGHARVDGNLVIASNRKLYLGSNSPSKAEIRVVSHDDANFFDVRGNLHIRACGQNFGDVKNGNALTIQKNGSIVMGSWPSNPMKQLNTQDHRLMVNGGILCEKLKVIRDVPNSDHVFEKNYKLMTLEEVKSFVEKNKHLPEIPSAKDFKENGYNIGEMDDLLLRKVEELTLYLIELKEENDELSKKVETLNSIVSK